MKNDLASVKYTLFVEDTPENANEICKLIRAISLLDGGWNATVVDQHYDRKEIETFFESPLARLVFDGDHSTRHASAVLLLGQLKLPDGLLDNEKDGGDLVRRTLIERWRASSLRCDAYPKWNTVCEERIVLWLR